MLGSAADAYGYSWNDRANPEPLNTPLLRIVLKHLLSALDFLHTEAKIIHTGMTIVNINHPF